MDTVRHEIDRRCGRRSARRVGWLRRSHFSSVGSRRGNPAPRRVVPRRCSSSRSVDAARGERRSDIASGGCLPAAPDAVPSAAVPKPDQYGTDSGRGLAEPLIELPQVGRTSSLRRPQWLRADLRSCARRQTRSLSACRQRANFSERRRITDPALFYATCSPNPSGVHETGSGARLGGGTGVAGARCSARRTRPAAGRGGPRHVRSEEHPPVQRFATVLARTG